MIYAKLFQLFVALNLVNLITGTCNDDRIKSTPTSIYEDLKCIPKYEHDCIKEYDCSHIYNRPDNTCHFKGKFYNVGEQIDNEELTGVWEKDCKCSESLQFSCAELTDGCPEDWVGNYPRPGCYMRYELNQYCATEEICPPFDELRKCEVQETTYREGDKFMHPDKKCTECVCDEYFNTSLDPPFCQPVNCSEELTNSNFIDEYCAPFYKDGGGCCPDAWICLSLSTVVEEEIPEPTLSGPKCKLGHKEMYPGGSLTLDNKEFGIFICECNIPPFFNCFPLTTWQYSFTVVWYKMMTLIIL